MKIIRRPLGASIRAAYCNARPYESWNNHDSGLECLCEVTRLEQEADGSQTYCAEITNQSILDTHACL